MTICYGAIAEDLRAGAGSGDFRRGGKLRKQDGRMKRGVGGYTESGTR
jgi:hypothetical protein